MSNIRGMISEIVSESVNAKKISLHKGFKDKFQNTYYEGGGSSSVSTTRFIAQNSYFKEIEKMILKAGYKKVASSRNDAEYHMAVNGTKRTAKVTVSMNGDRVYSVDTLTYLNHY